MDEPIRYVAWKRQIDSGGAWVLLPHTEADNRTAAYNLAMEEELKAGDVGWEYQIMPTGVVPERDSYRTQPGNYLNRAMRTGRG